MKHRGLRGFSLLEVMVALALLAISFTTLILAQGRATRLAIQAKQISISTQLARYQLMECKREVQKNIGMVSDFKMEGDFSEIGQPDFSWECHAPKFNMKPPSATQIEATAKKNTPKNQEGSASQVSGMSAPFIGMITDSLGTAVRELVVIVRWKDGEIEEETRVVTHVVDLVPIAALSRMLSQGAETFLGQGKKQAETPGQDGAAPNPPPGQPMQGPPQGFPQGSPQGMPPPGFRGQP